MKSKRIMTLLTVSILSILIISGMSEVTAMESSFDDLFSGPYVDKLVYKVIANQNNRILALQSGEIELDTTFFDPVHYETLDSDPDIDIYNALRNGYGHITINTRDAPLNESVLRRAFAFAFNKTKVRTDILDGFAQDHDSLVPIVNSWCVEDEFDWHYYTDQSEYGNTLLNNTGIFEIDEATGFRTYKGTPFDIKIEYAASSPEIAGGTAQIGVDALRNLHINAETRAADFNEYISRLDSHGDYDMVFYAVNFYSNDVDWLAYEYWSEYADEEYQNPSNFMNVSYDLLRNQLLNGTTYEAVYEAATAMQEILHYNVPRLVVYESIYNQAYRIDEYTGHVADLGQYISGSWTTRNIRKLDASPGGTVPIAIGEEPDSFNIFVTNSAYSTGILSNLYSGLFKLGPDLTPVPDLAQNMLIETHSDNAAVPTGHTRFTIDINQNAIWSDGMPLTAEDVAFTFTYAYESAVYGNPAGSDLGDLVASFAPTPYRVIIEFSTESYWQFSKFAYDNIIPIHIFNNSGGIGYTGWNTWNPVFDPSEPHVTSGPFIFTDYEAGEFYELTANPLFYHPPESTAPIVTGGGYFNYIYNTTGNEIVWQASDDNPFSYAVFKDQGATPVASSMWDGSDIRVNVDGLDVGTYEYNLVVSDYSGNFVYNAITVVVTNQTSGTNTRTSTTTDTSTTTTTSTTGGGIPFDGNTLTILISTGAIGIILVVAVLIYKTKQV